MTYRYHIDAGYCDIYGGALPSHTCMDTPLPEDTSEDRPHIAFTPYLRQLTASVLLTGSRIRSIALVLSMII